MTKGGTVTLDADEYLKLLDELAELEQRLRSLGSTGFNGSGRGKTTRPDPTRQRKAEKASEGRPFELRGFNIDAMDWKKKDSSPAGRHEGWAWAFSMDMEGDVLPETSELVQACEQYGEVQVGPYLIKIGGRDRNLLNRRTLKK